MLIHAVLYVKWIDCLAKLVNEQMRVYKHLIQGRDPELILELKDLFESDFLPTTKDILNDNKLGYIDIKIKNISLYFNDINIFPYPNTSNLYQINFKEFYKSDTYKFEGDKTLIVELDKNNKIRIITEK